MNESDLNSNNNRVYKVLIALYLFNIIIHTYCIGLGLYLLVLGPVDELGVFFVYLMGVFPTSMFFAILIMVFNHKKKENGVKYENYMLYLTLGLIFTAFVSGVFEISIFHQVVIILSVPGIIISIRAIRNLRSEIKINNLIK